VAELLDPSGDSQHRAPKYQKNQQTNQMSHGEKQSTSQNPTTQGKFSSHQLIGILKIRKPILLWGYFLSEPSLDGPDRSDTLVLVDM
jgi:hypothetical protein